MGLPDELAFTPKKATQFSSGSSKLLTKAILKEAALKDIKTMKQAEAVTQTVLNRIGIEVGLSIKDPSARKLELNVDPSGTL
jgi:hypothetical protein